MKFGLPLLASPFSFGLSVFLLLSSGKEAQRSEECDFRDHSDIHVVIAPSSLKLLQC